MWLVENTALSFEQIAEFSQLHQLEVKAMADGEVGIGLKGQNPIVAEQLTQEEIERCEKDPSVRLQIKKRDLPEIQTRSKGPRYTPVAKRSEKPDGIAYIIKNHPEVTDAQIVRLIGTTKSTIEKIRDRSHWNISNIKPRDPVILGLCKQTDLNAAVEKSRKKLPADAVPPANDFASGDQPSDAGFEKLMG
jgi:hypothetical protein